MHALFPLFLLICLPYIPLHLIKMIFMLAILSKNYVITTVVSPGDYGSVIGQLIQFNTGDTKQMHTIIISQDDICETDPDEFFFSNIALVSGTPPIDVIHPQATAFINDSLEPECGKLWIQIPLLHVVCSKEHLYTIYCTLSLQLLKLAMTPLYISQVRAREWWSSISLSSVILILEHHNHSLSLSPLKMALQVCLK